MKHLKSGLKRRAFVCLLFACICGGAGAGALPDEVKDAFKKAGLPLLAIQREAPDFTLPAAADEKESVTLKSLRGGVVVLNFWASWCPPCRSEMPSLDALYGYFRKPPAAGDAGEAAAFRFFAIDTGEDAQTVRSFIKKNPYTFPVLLDRTGGAGRAYSVRAIPVTVIIDTDGNMLAYLPGARDWNTKEIRGALGLLLQSRGPAKP